MLDIFCLDMSTLYSVFNCFVFNKAIRGTNNNNAVMRYILVNPKLIDIPTINAPDKS